jgi:hypothetical protein
MRLIHKLLWLAHVSRLLNIGAPDSPLFFSRLRAISLVMRTIAVLLASVIAAVFYSPPSYLNRASFACCLVLPTSIFCLIAYFANGFYFGTLFFRISGTSLEVHDWKLETGRKAGDLERDLVACLPKVASSGASSVVIKSHILGKFNEKQLEGLIRRKIKQLGVQNITYEILPHTPVKFLDRQIMFMMGIQLRSKFESGFRIKLTETNASNIAKF